MSYYFVKPASLGGSDTADGTTHATAWATVSKVNSVQSSLASGDFVKFFGNNTYSGTTLLPTKAGVTYTSYGSIQKAIISVSSGNGITVQNTASVVIDGLIVAGPNTDTPSGGSDPAAFRPAGIEFYNSSTGTTQITGCKVTNCEVYGFITGIWAYTEHSEVGTPSTSGYTGIQITDNHVHDCAAFGIQLWNPIDHLNRPKYIDLYIARNNIHDIRGYSTRVSGIPIAVGCGRGSNLWTGAATAVIEDNVLSDSGYASTNTGGGAGGIVICGCKWVMCRGNIARRISSTAGNVDGIGFDIDWTCQECVYEFNFSHDCDGAGFYMFQCVDGNCFRYNVSWNDAKKAAVGHSGITTTQIGQLNYIFGNIVINTLGTVNSLIDVQDSTGSMGVLNNVLYRTGSASGCRLLTVVPGACVIIGNVYWAPDGFQAVVQGVGALSLASMRKDYVEHLTATDYGYAVKPEWVDALDVKPPEFDNAKTMRAWLWDTLGLNTSSALYGVAVPIKTSTPVWLGDPLALGTKDMAGETIGVTFNPGAFTASPVAEIPSAAKVAKYLMDPGIFFKSNNQYGEPVALKSTQDTISSTVTDTNTSLGQVTDQLNEQDNKLDDVAEAVDNIEPGASAGDIAAALAGTVNVIVWSPATGWELSLYHGDSYAGVLGIPITKQPTETHWPTTLNEVHFRCAPTNGLLDLESAAVGLNDIACTVTQSTGDAQAFTILLTATQTAGLSFNRKLPNAGYKFWLVANKTTNPRTLRSGPLTLQPRYADLVS